jgi:anaerobic selenocysteine-containing dehydrogenase
MDAPPRTRPVVGPREQGWSQRLDVGNDEMLTLLADATQTRPADDLYPFRLISRRTRELFNSTVNDGVTTNGVTHNPAYLRPDDVAALGLKDGDFVEIRSPLGHRHCRERQLVAPRTRRDGAPHTAASLRRRRSRSTRAAGSNVAALIDDEIDFDPSRQLRMSDVPVAVLTMEAAQ